MIHSNTKQVSVIIPAYNAEKFLALTLDSLLAQTHPANEILIVNDGSTDQTAFIALEYSRQYPPIKLLNQENTGSAGARNNGLKSAVNEYLAFVDADDIVLPNFLAHLLAKANPNSIVVPDYQQIDLSGNVINAYQAINVREAKLPGLLYGNQIPVTVVFGRKVLQAAGDFDESLKGYFEDWDWFVRALLKGAVIEHVPEVLWQYRIHDNGQSRKTLNVDLMFWADLKILDKIFNEYTLPIAYRRHKQAIYYHSYVVFAQMFWVNDLLDKSRDCLKKAQEVNPADFYSPLTFIRFLKSLTQLNIGNKNLDEVGEAAISWVAASANAIPKQRQLQAYGELILGVFQLRNNRQAFLNQIIKTLKICPMLPFQAGLYRTLFHYIKIFVGSVKNKLASP